jgi:hypothetical protein
VILDINKAINKYKPATIKVLFVAEAPGNNAKHFYLANTNLYRSVYTAFRELFGEFDTPDAFLHHLESLHCYVDHLSLKPIDKLNASSRIIAREQSILPLSERIGTYQPLIVLTLMKAIREEVRKAIELSGFESIVLQRVTSYPAGNAANRTAFIREIVDVMRDYTSLEDL